MKIKNKVLTAGLALSVLFTGVSSAQAMSFEDSYGYLKSSDYIRDYSNGEFLPQRQMTRDEAAWLLSLSSYDENFKLKVPTSFSDVSQDNFYVPYIEKVKKLGIMNGVSDFEFKPFDKITRYQTAAILNRAFQVNSKSTSNTSCFKDVEVNHWAKNDICTLKDLGVVNGTTDGEFKGSNNVTKSQFTMMYARLMQTEFYLDEIDYKFEDEVKNNFYIQNGRNLVKVNPQDKLPLATIQKMKKMDKALKEQKGFLGENLTKLMVNEPLAFALTKSEFISGNGGFYYHKNETANSTYVDNMPEMHLIAVSDNYNNDESFKRIFVHELGHYLGYSALHKNKDYSEFSQFKNLESFNPGQHYIKGWGDLNYEVLADSYTEIALEGFENRTYVGNFKNSAERANFKAWVKQKINSVIYNNQ